jgi:hypothetical protein
MTARLLMNDAIELTKEDARSLLLLREGCATELRGVTYTRFGDEVKVSPYGAAGDFDHEHTWIDRDDLRFLATDGRNHFQEILSAVDE